MAEIKQIPSSKPSDKIIEEAKKTHEIRSDDGRVFVLQEPDITADVDLVAALGKAAENSAMLAIMAPLTYIKSIDGDDVVFPRTFNEARALMRRVGRTGMKAIAAALAEYYGESVSEEAEKAEIKK